MNRSTQLRRKIVYIAVLVVMLIPLYLLGQPAGGGGEGGGKLAQLRDNYDIAESDLGEISPASETMKLASLGLRGVAASLLWKKSHEYRVMHEWDRLKATLNNIALLQPHFDKVWEFQAHNLAYNVSTEFDDYRQRYEMVREGTEFLTKGVKQNRKAPRLVWYTGWFYGQKMGMSDEKKQFRRLFADDEVIHKSLAEQGIAVDSLEARGPLGKPDNWLVGRLWLNSGYDLVASGVKIRRQTPLNFYETGPKWRIKHAEAIESEGILDERAEDAWRMASQDWRAFGERSVPTTATFTIKLGRLEELKRQKTEAIESLREVASEAFEQAELAKIQTLDPILQDALLTPEDKRSKSQQSIADNYSSAALPNFSQIAEQASSENRLSAMQLADDIKDIDARIRKTTGYRNQINFEYWDTLAMAEQEERTVRARRLTYEAEQANADAELEKAISLYEQSFAVWAEIFDDYPILVIDDSAEDLFESIRRYQIAIDTDEIAEDFPLKTFVELMGQYGQVNAKMYEEVRQSQQKLLAERKSELAEQERLRDQAEEAAENDAKPEMPEPKKDTDSAKAKDLKKSEPEPAKEKTADVEKDKPAKAEKDEAMADAKGDEQPDATGDKQTEKPPAEESEPAKTDDKTPKEETKVKEEPDPKEAEKAKAEKKGNQPKEGSEQKSDVENKADVDTAKESAATELDVEVKPAADPS